MSIAGLARGGADPDRDVLGQRHHAGRRHGVDLAGPEPAPGRRRLDHAPAAALHGLERDVVGCLARHVEHHGLQVRDRRGARPRAPRPRARRGRRRRAPRRPRARPKRPASAAGSVDSVGHRRPRSPAARRGRPDRPGRCAATTRAARARPVPRRPVCQITPGRPQRQRDREQPRTGARSPARPALPRGSTPPWRPSSTAIAASTAPKAAQERPAVADAAIGLGREPAPQHGMVSMERSARGCGAWEVVGAWMHRGLGPARGAYAMAGTGGSPPPRPAPPCLPWHAMADLPCAGTAPRGPPVERFRKHGRPGSPHRPQTPRPAAPRRDGQGSPPMTHDDSPPPGRPRPAGQALPRDRHLGRRRRPALHHAARPRPALRRPRGDARGGPGREAPGGARGLIRAGAADGHARRARGGRPQ